MRISDWSSDVCSSDLAITQPFQNAPRRGGMQDRQQETSQVQWKREGYPCAISRQTRPYGSRGSRCWPQERFGARHLGTHLGFYIARHDNIDLDAFLRPSVAHAFSVDFDSSLADRKSTR